jgi:hypothetical protein
MYNVYSPFLDINNNSHLIIWSVSVSPIIEYYVYAKQASEIISVYSVVEARMLENLSFNFSDEFHPCDKVSCAL